MNSVLEQALTQADFEVIVVNDSGKPLVAAPWQSSPRVRVINTNQCERSIARNSGAAIANGKYLAFLDDDDWILPGALETFYQLALENSDADWLYGGIRIVDEKDGILGEINSGLRGSCFSQFMGGAWAPLQTSVIHSQAFYKAGGFSPFICGTEDLDLCRQISYFGTFANTPEVVGCLFRGQSWSTSTNYLRGPEDTKYARDTILSYQSVFTKLMKTAKTSYWFGRNFHIYLSTAIWNIKKKRYFTAISRLIYSFFVLLISFRHLLQTDFWQGVRAHHVPDTLHFAMLKYERNKQNQDNKN